MSHILLVLRPEPGATHTTRRAQAAGFTIITAPLFTVRAIDWTPPEPANYDAVILTSANAARFGGAGLAACHARPVYAVGAATARAARAVGFTTVYAGEGDVEDLLAIAAADGARRVLHLAGQAHRPATHPALNIDRRIVYAADPVTDLPLAAASALDAGAIALLHSPRAAALFRMLVERSGRLPARIGIAAISANALATAGNGWRTTMIAASPTDDALLAVAAKLCDQIGEGQAG